MMNELFNDILKKWVSLEKYARDLYNQFSLHAPSAELNQFWGEMSREEETHIRYWEDMLKLSEKGAIPPIFPDPQKILNDLECIHDEISNIGNEEIDFTDVYQTFLFAYRLEINMINPPMAYLVSVADWLYQDESPIENYDRHIRKFLDFLTNYGLVRPELELLGETIEKLWDENKKLVHLSRSDYLTKVWNRTGFFETLLPLVHMSHRQKNRVAICMVDIDNFKEINDNHGHREGDRILRLVADSLKKHTRSSDLIGRFGGDEFIIFLSVVDEKSLPDIIRKIRKRIDDETPPGIRVTLSIGVSHGIPGSRPESEIHNMIHHADTLMYKAKQQGRNSESIEEIHKISG